METYHDPEAGVRIDRGAHGGSVQLTLTAPAAVGLLNAIRRYQSTYLPISTLLGSLQEGLQDVLKAEEAGQRLDPAFSGPAVEVSRVRQGDPLGVRVIRSGIPTEPGVALGSDPLAYGRNLCIGSGPHEDGIHIEGCPDGE